MTPRRDAPPFWFQLLAAIVIACALRVVLAPWAPAPLGDGHAPPVTFAFLQFLIGLVSLIWKGIEVAGKVTLEVLKWTVVNLSLVVTKLGNGLKTLGAGLLTAAKKTWDFFRLTYDRVIKPAIQNFWRTFDRLRRWLDDTFAPVLRFLRDVRDSLLSLYKTWIRPWLDLIDVTRHALRVLGSLGLQWARALDAKLGALEDKIERPFRYVLAKVNEVINLVNRVVTLDGLLQRVALIRSLERDYLFAWRAAVNPWSKAITAADRDAQAKAAGAKTLPQITAETRAYMRDHSGPRAPLLDEMRLIWRGYLTGR